MNKVELKGIITPILSPMNPDESINLDELRNQIDRLIEGGVHGIFPFGTNGEGYILREEEKLRIESAKKFFETLKNEGINVKFKKQMKEEDVVGIIYKTLE